MSILSVPPLITAGIVFYAGFYQLLIYTRRREQRKDLTFGLTCLAAGGYMLSCAGLYSANSVVEGVQWQRVQVVALAYFALFFLWFIKDNTGCVSTRALQIFSVYYIVAGFVVALDRSRLTWIVDQPAVKNISLPLGLSITYYEATPGPLVNFQSIVGLILSLYILWVSVQFYRDGDRSRAKRLLAAIAFLIVAVINDTAVSSGLYQFVYVIEYAYLAIIVLMAYSLSNDVLEAAHIKDALRESEERFRNIVQASPMGMHMYRLEADGRLIFVGANPAADKILGVDNQHFIGKTIEEAFPPLVHTEVPERYRRACSQGESWTTEQIVYGDEFIRGAFEVYAFQTAPGMMTVLFLDITERKRTEEALRRERDLLNSVMETSPAAIIVVDCEGRITFANTRSEQVLGLSRVEIGQRSYNAPEWRITDYQGDPFPDEELPFSQVMNTARPVFGVRHAIEYPDGKRVLLSVNAAPLLKENGKLNGMVSTVEDVTAQIQAERDLKVSEERYRIISELASDFAYAVTVHPDGSITPEWVTGAFARISGYTIEDFENLSISGNWHRLVHPEDLPMLSLSVQSASDQPLGPGNVRILTKTGEIRWLQIYGRPIIDDLSGQITRIIGAAQDITERMQAEEALGQYMDRLEILREIDRAILAAQSPQDIAEAALSHIQSLVSCQRASVATFDYKANEARILAVVGEHDTQIPVGPFLSLDEFILDDGFEHGEVRIIDDLKSLDSLTPLRRDLLKYGLRAIVNVPLIAQDELIGSLNLASQTPRAFSSQQIEVSHELADILAVAIQQARLHERVRSHSRELEESVRKRTAELEAKNRELETFTYSVSHDLKAPLRGIDGYSRLLLENYEDQLDADGHFFLQSIRRATKQMNQLINDLLTYSRLERRSLGKEQIHLPSLLEAVLSERQDEIKNREVRVTLNLPLEYLTAEVEGLRQALRNLLDNALKFTQNVSQPLIEFGGNRTEKTYILWIKDNGIGFDMQYHDRIFEIFHRLHRVEEYPGTGIGLALVHKVMQRLGGRVWAESAPGAGATFYLEIPNELL